MKFICGLLFSIAIIYIGVLCINAPEAYDYVGALSETILSESLTWYVGLLIFLIPAAVATAAIFASLSACDSVDLPIISYIICCIAGLGISGVDAVNHIFDQNIAISSTVSMWSNLTPLIAILLAIIYCAFCTNYEWWHILVIVFGGISAILVGIMVCIGIVAVIWMISFIFYVILFIGLLIAFFAAISR